jgi:gamma-glutamyl:cysteine ligase YbdK (ATP-grasp superfamily)
VTAACGPAVLTGATVGVEEEFHLVDRDTLELTSSPEVTAAVLGGTAGAQVHAEIATTQLETSTGICGSLADLRAALVTTRAEAAEAAVRAGLAVLAASTPPFGSWRQMRMTPAPRYQAIRVRWAVLADPRAVAAGVVREGPPG